jgi:hypothetical protein
MNLSDRLKKLEALAVERRYREKLERYRLIGLGEASAPPLLTSDLRDCYEESIWPVYVPLEVTYRELLEWNE